MFVQCGREPGKQEESAKGTGNKEAQDPWQRPYCPLTNRPVVTFGCEHGYYVYICKRREGSYFKSPARTNHKSMLPLMIQEQSLIWCAENSQSS